MDTVECDAGEVEFLCCAGSEGMCVGETKVVSKERVVRRERNQRFEMKEWVGVLLG